MKNKDMKTPAGQTAEKVLEAQIGRSLWDDAWARLRANKAAMASFIALFVIAVACFVGPIVSPHDYDAVYRNYVKVPASLEAYPREADIQPALEKVLKRARLTAEAIEINDGKIIAKVSSRRSIQEKSARYVDRSDLFKGAAITDISEDGKSATVMADIDKKYFLFGTDANGRDLMTRTLIAGRVSLVIGLLASGVALLIGVTYGSLSGYFGGRVDLVMMRIVDVLYSLPFIFFVILLVVFFGRNFILMFIAVGAV
ncbi:MAG: ABC transporter permease, partial [Cohaesibacter sp.]|nr:ABC transporter permease [Cohaesibacter sp.]